MGSMRKRCLAGILLFLMKQACAEGALCLESEDLVFSCQLKNGNTASICGLKTPADQRRLQYRYGIGKKVEIAVPGSTRVESAAAVERGWFGGSLGVQEYYRFREDSVVYSVIDYSTEFSTMTGKRCRSSATPGCHDVGVVVEKPGNDDLHLACKVDRSLHRFSLFSEEFQKKYGVKDDPAAPWPSWP